MAEARGDDKYSMNGAASMTGPPLARNPATRSEAMIEGSLVIGLLVAYPLLRFLIGEPALFLLYGATLLWALAALSAGRIRIVPILWFAPLGLLAILGWLSCWLAGKAIEANYYLFTTLYFILLATLPTTRFSYSRSVARWIGFLFCLSTVPFALVPSLIYDLGCAKYLSVLTEAAGEEFITMNNYQTPEERFHAYFIHANELGVFAAALFFVIVVCQKGEPSRFAKVGDFLIAGALAFLVLISGSATAMVAVVAALAIRFAGPRRALLGAYAVFAFMFASQLFFPGRMMDLLQQGSFFWRYAAAEEIVAVAGLVKFDPSDIGLVGTWPHSIFLDYTFLLGLTGAWGLFILVSIYALRMVPQYIGAAVLTFFVCAAVQPAGAMPSSLLLLAAAIAVLTSNSEREAAARGPQHVLRAS